MLLRLALVATTLWAAAWAQVQFLKPASGAAAALSEGKLLVEWVPTDDMDVAGYHILLMAGGDSDHTSGQVATISGSKTATDGSSSVLLPVITKAGPAAFNAYFLKMLVKNGDGTTTTFHSDRFSIAGMNGIFPRSQTGLGSDAVEEAYKMVRSDVVAVPRQVVRQAAGEPLPYSLQTAGDIKTAPMQSLPPTSITAQNTDPLYPTSAVDFASTYLPIPSFITTETIARTWATTSMVNTAAAAESPADDMARFLERWKD